MNSGLVYTPLTLGPCGSERTAGGEKGERLPLGKPTDQLTLWEGSGPQVLSQKTVALHHTERCRGAAGSGPRAETRLSPRKEKAVTSASQTQEGIRTAEGDSAVEY